MRRILEPVAQRATELVGALAALAVALLAFHVILHTVLRAAGMPLADTTDIVRYWWMTTMGFGAMAVAHRNSEHIEATILFEMMPPVLRRVWAFFANAVTVVVLLLLATYGFQAALRQMEIGEHGAAGGNIPIWPMRFWVPVGAFVYVLVVIAGGRNAEPDDAAAPGGGGL